MKVQRISFGDNITKTQQINPAAPQPAVLSEFACLPKNQPEAFNRHNFRKFLIGCAAAAVIVTLFRIKGRRKLPDSIVELGDKNLGLNKIPFKRTAKELKTSILYPLKAHLAGDKSIIKSKKHFKSGVIIADNDVASTKDVLDAFYEHAQNLGIRCRRISECASRKKENKMKWVKDAIKEAQETFKKEGKLTLIDIGNMDNLINLKIFKRNNSNLENQLIEISKNSYSGVVWTAYTNRTKQIPMYYNDLPVIVTKLMD